MNARKNLRERLFWYWNRLQCMSLGEIGARTYHLVNVNALKVGLLSAAKVPQPNFNNDGKKWICRPDSYLDSQDYCCIADRILNQDIPFFAVKKKFSEIIRDWNRCPKTGIKAPSGFGPAIKIADASICGDIKYLWEPNRHLFLVPLAQAYQLSGRNSYLDALKNALMSWLDQCPYLQGPNWNSSLELGIRLINWSIIWQLIGGRESELFNGESGKILRSQWIRSIYQHAHFVKNNLSFYSSANNHLIGEVAGLFVAATTWPYWPELEKAGKKAYKSLEKEALKQNAADGTNREQALAYQQFVLDFLIMALLAGQPNGYKFSDTFWRRIETMIDFFKSIIDINGNAPQIGDADDGFVSNLSSEKDFCNYHSLLATGAVLFNRKDYKAKAGRLDHKTCWLLGQKAVDMFAAEDVLPPSHSIKRAFNDGGYYILGKNFEKENEIRCIVYCGPLGYLSIAAHGHAAALAVYLTVGGREILIDPGTYIYHGQDRWRHYFRGTSAHCTLSVDDLDQSVSGGKFMWTKHACTHLESWQVDDKMDRFSGYHDGYLGLEDPVIHQREVAFDKSRDCVTITDLVKCQKTHTIKRFWHFSEDCNVVLKDNKLFVENNGIVVVMATKDPESNIQLVRGDEDLPLGWVSRGFDHKVPSYTAIMQTVISGNSKLSSTIDIKANSLV